MTPEASHIVIRVEGTLLGPDDQPWSGPLQVELLQRDPGRHITMGENVIPDGLGHFSVEGTWPWEWDEAPALTLIVWPFESPARTEDRHDFWFTAQDSFRWSLEESPVRLDPQSGQYSLGHGAPPLPIEYTPLYGTLHFENPHGYSLTIYDSLFKSHSGPWGGVRIGVPNEIAGRPYSGDVALYAWDEQPYLWLGLGSDEACLIDPVNLPRHGTDRVVVSPAFEYSCTIPPELYAGDLRIVLRWPSDAESRGIRRKDPQNDYLDWWPWEWPDAYQSIRYDAGQSHYRFKAVRCDYILQLVKEVRDSEGKPMGKILAERQFKDIAGDQHIAF
ncbi:MAG: hypothetical protein R3F33_06860 [Planctomycetota bacterium]